jgi:hypothetical protein
MPRTAGQPTLASIRIDTSEYVAAHGQAPAGVRTWGFAFEEPPSVFLVRTASYGAAKGKAVRAARQRGATVIRVVA